MEHFKDNSGCSGKKKSEIFWNNSRKVQYVFAGVMGKMYLTLLNVNVYLWSKVTRSSPYKLICIMPE